MTALGEADRRAVARYLHALDDSGGRLDARLASEFDRLSPAQLDVLVAALLDDEAERSDAAAEASATRSPARVHAPADPSQPPEAPARRRRLERVFGPAADEIRTVLEVGGAMLAGAAVITGFALAAVGGIAPAQMTADPGISEPATSVEETVDDRLLDDLTGDLWETGADDWY